MTLTVKTDREWTYIALVPKNGYWALTPDGVLDIWDGRDFPTATYLNVVAAWESE